MREGRPDAAAGIARVHVDSWRTTYAGILPAEYLASLSYEERERLWNGWLADAAKGERVVCVAEETREAPAAPAALEAPAAPETPAAPDARRIVGFASGGAATRETQRLAPAYEAELHTIYLLRSHQRRGLGRALFRFAAERLAAGGARSLFVWVARDNPSRAFYEALGGRLMAETRMEIFGQAVDEVGYGWEDIGRLLGRLGTPDPRPPTPE